MLTPRIWPSAWMVKVVPIVSTGLNSEAIRQMGLSAAPKRRELWLSIARTSAPDALQQLVHTSRTARVDIRLEVQLRYPEQCQTLPKLVSKIMLCAIQGGEGFLFGGVRIDEMQPHLGVLHSGCHQDFGNDGFTDSRI